MSPIVWQCVVVAAIAGHCGLQVAIYNRVNSFGYSRFVIKCIEHFFLAVGLLIPITLGWLYRDFFWDVLLGRPNEVPLPNALLVYGIVCLAVWILFGVPWLMWRPALRLEWINASREIEVVNVQDQLGIPLALSTKCKLQWNLPLNQIFDLSIEEISLPVAGLPRVLDGYKVSHFSDIHLTGHVHGDFTKYVVQRATDWQPDLMAVTGDIIDSQVCVPWLYDIFSSAVAPDGCYFILGNHDLRIADSNQTRDEMKRAGWIDAATNPTHRLLRGVDSLILGNEAPWFPRPTIEDNQADFRLLLSHCPDQLQWARKHRVHLMLAGHTHGGQGRLPLVGPILSPSIHGSRYASGDFYKSPTTMHVSRGLSGTHVIRINCRPQLSLLTLKAV